MQLKKKAMHSDWAEEYKEVFKGVGRLPGEHKIKLRVNAEPVIHPARKVPVALKERLKEKLDTLIREGIIRKVEEPTEWVNSLVIVEKPDGDLSVMILVFSSFSLSSPAATHLISLFESANQIFYRKGSNILRDTALTFKDT